MRMIMKKERVQLGRVNDINIYTSPELRRSQRYSQTPQQLLKPQQNYQQHRSSFVNQNTFKYDVFNPGSDQEPFIKKLNKSTPQKTLQPSESEQKLDIPLNADRLKILAIRQALRNKFSREKDMKKLYSSWDRDSIGVIRPQDLQIVLQQIGLVCQIEDIKALISAVSATRIGALTFQDFSTLLQQKQETYDLDAYIMSNLIEFNSKGSLNVSYRIRKIQNLLKYYLNIHQQALTQQLTVHDLAGTGRVTYNQFLRIINILGIPYHTVNGLNLKILFFDFGGDIYGIDYHKFLQKIKKCRPFELDNEEEVEINIDKKMLTVSKFDDLVDNPSKIKRLIKLSVKTKDNLLKELLERFGTKVRKNELRMYVANKGRMPEDQIEAFLSVFSYDQRGEAGVSGIVQWVFDKNSEDFMLRDVVLPRLARNQQNPTLRFKQFLCEIQAKVKNIGLFDGDMDTYITKKDFREGLRDLDILFDKSDIDKLFEGFLESKVFIPTFEVRMAEMIKEYCRGGKSYLRPVRGSKCQRRLFRKSTESANDKNVSRRYKSLHLQYN